MQIPYRYAGKRLGAALHQEPQWQAGSVDKPKAD